MCVYWVHCEDECHCCECGWIGCVFVHSGLCFHCVSVRRCFSLLSFLPPSLLVSLFFSPLFGCPFPCLCLCLSVSASLRSRLSVVFMSLFPVFSVLSVSLSVFSCPSVGLRDEALAVFIVALKLSLKCLCLKRFLLFSWSILSTPGFVH